MGLTPVKRRAISLETEGDVMMVSVVQRSLFSLGLVVFAGSLSGCKKVVEIQIGREQAVGTCRADAHASNAIWLQSCERAVGLGADRARAAHSEVRYVLDRAGTLSREGQILRDQCMRPAGHTAVNLQGCDQGIQNLEHYIVRRERTVLARPSAPGRSVDPSDFYPIP